MALGVSVNGMGWSSVTSGVSINGQGWSSVALGGPVSGPRWSLKTLGESNNNLDGYQQPWCVDQLPGVIISGLELVDQWPGVVTNGLGGSINGLGWVEQWPGWSFTYVCSTKLVIEYIL